MSCNLGRGDSAQPVWHMNNWLSTFGLADANKAAQVNDYETLLNRALLCWEEVEIGLLSLQLITGNKEN